MLLADSDVVLIAAPSAALRRNLCADLGRAGVVGLPARDAAEAVAKLERYPEVGAVLLDEELPDLAALVAGLRRRRPGLSLVGLGRWPAFAGLGLRRVLPPPWSVEAFLAPPSGVNGVA